jgi:phosphoribosylaminoimidazolecarboxamide formyltransferase/IMP cyclohydrolase
MIHETEFIECVLAPDYDTDALELMKKKKNRRLLAVGNFKSPAENDLEIRAITGGALVQTRDKHQLSARDLTIVTKVKPTPAQIEDMLFGFQVVKHVKSNAVLICKDGATVGIGPGQTSRVDSSLIAARKAGERAKDAVAASDAFFPMPDGFEVLAKAGVKAVIQPGGSKGDSEVIAAADKLASLWCLPVFVISNINYSSGSQGRGHRVPFIATILLKVSVLIVLGLRTTANN